MRQLTCIVCAKCSTRTTERSAKRNNKSKTHTRIQQVVDQIYHMKGFLRYTTLIHKVCAFTCASVDNNNYTILSLTL